MQLSRFATASIVGSLMVLLIPTPGSTLPVVTSSMSIKESQFFPICSQANPTNCIEEVSVQGVPLLPARVLSNTEVRYKDSQGRESGIVFEENRRPFWKCIEGGAFESLGGRSCGVGDYPNFLIHPEDVNLNFPLGPGGRKPFDYTTEEGKTAARTDNPSSYPPAYVGVQVFAAPSFRDSENGFNSVIGSYGFHFDVFNERGFSMTTKENDEFTFRINFGFVPAPNFYANANVTKYDVSVDQFGATIVEMTLRPVVGAAPPIQGDCAGHLGGPKTLFLNTGRFSWGNSSTDVETGTELPFAGNAVTTNGPCASGMPDIRPDGTLNVVLGAPHLNADGSLNTGEFTVILPRATMYAFGFGVDRILLGGLKMGLQTASRVKKLDYQATIADNGVVVIRASNFHYSTPTLSIKKSSFKSPQLKEKLNVSSSSEARRGKSFELIVNSSIANASVFVRGSRGGPQFVRTLKGVPAQSRLSITIPRSVPTGRGSLVVWYPGDRTSRNTSTEIPIRITQ